MKDLVNILIIHRRIHLYKVRCKKLILVLFIIITVGVGRVVVIQTPAFNWHLESGTCDDIILEMNYTYLHIPGIIHIIS